MNTIKPICISAFAAIVLAGCGAQKQTVSLPTLPMITAPMKVKKTTALTENQLQRWSHLDIVCLLYTSPSPRD